MNLPTAKTLAALAVASLAAAAFVGVNAPASATHLPADKIGVAADSLEIMSAQFSPLQGPLGLGQALGGVGPDTSSEVVPLLGGVMRTSSPTDLIFRLTTECALWTNVTVSGNAESQAEATVKIWVTVDGNPVKVSANDPDEGKVVFCNRVYHLETTEQENENFTINTFIRTREANAFQWVALNVGNGVHTIEAFAQLETQVTGAGEASAAVGKRVLTVEPVKLANDVSI